MPHTRQPATGSFVCHHLATADPGAAEAFYGRLFGWTARDIRLAGGLGATTFRSGDLAVATAGPVVAVGLSSQWLPCLAVADIGAAAGDAERLGAALAFPADEQATDTVVVVDPAGARFCMTGSYAVCGQGGDAAAPGRFCWAELKTGDPEGAAAFYQRLVGWTSVERFGGRDGRYWVFRHAGRDVAGMVQDPGTEGPACWVPYVQVISPEETAELAIELGGTLVMPAGDVPGRGRFAVFRDPGGALVAVFALTDAA